MNILYIAYSCAPNNGTEDKPGWFIPFEAAKYNRVWVITKPDGKSAIDSYLRKNPSQLEMIYVDIPTVYKKLFRGAFYSGRLNIWHKRAERAAEHLCVENKIEIIHQINPVEFRSIGDYGRFGAKYVCGPLGGGEYMQREVRSYARRSWDKELIRSAANQLYKTKYRLSGRIGSIDKLLFANEETRSFLMGACEKNCPVLTELGSTGRKTVVERPHGKETVFLAAGRLIYRKGFDLLLNAIEIIPSRYDIRCLIVGDGPERHRLEKIVQSSPALQSRVRLTGKVPFEKMEDQYKKADYLVMPSLRETTGSVILEALENGIPVVTNDRYGARNLLNGDNSVLYRFEGRDPAHVLSDAMIRAIDLRGQFDREKVAATAEAFTFARKNIEYMKIYRELTEARK